MAINYFYNSGVYQDNWSIGPTGVNFTLVKQSTYLEINGSGSDPSYASYVSTPINLSGQNTLTVKWRYNSTPAEGTFAAFGIHPDPTGVWENYDVLGQAEFNSVPLNNATTINVSGYNGDYYLFAGIHTDGFYGNTNLKIDQVYSSGIPISTGVTPNSGSLSYTLANLSINSSGRSTNLASLSGNLSNLPTMMETSVQTSGGVNVTLGGLSINTYSVLGVDNFGFTTWDINLDSLTLSAESVNSVSISGYSQLNNLNVISFAATTTNIGSTNITNSPFSLNINSSGGSYPANSAFGNNTLGGATLIGAIIVEPPVEPPTGGTGTSRYSIEKNKWWGKTNICLKKEYSASTLKLAHDCAVIIGPESLQVSSYPEPKVYTVCDCTINVPIYLNRPSSQNTQLIMSTSQQSNDIVVSGETIVPARSGIDYIHATGLVIIPSGSLYANMSINIATSGAPVNKYFNLVCSNVKSRNACNFGAKMNILILQSGV